MTSEVDAHASESTSTRIPGEIEKALPAMGHASRRLRPRISARAAPSCSSAAESTTLSRAKAALKLKEISYVQAEGLPAGELRHGPNALVDENFPIIVLATRDAADPDSSPALPQNAGSPRIH